MIKVHNKYNYPILLVNLLWLIFVIIFVIFRKPKNLCGEAFVDIALIISALLLAPVCLIIVAITNKITKHKYNTDFEFIAIPYIILGFLFGAFLLYISLT